MREEAEGEGENGQVVVGKVQSLQQLKSYHLVR